MTEELLGSFFADFGEISDICIKESSIDKVRLLVRALPRGDVSHINAHNICARLADRSLLLVLDWYHDTLQHHHDIVVTQLMITDNNNGQAIQLVLSPHSIVATLSSR
jgi:hypothetical protein